MKWEKHCSAAVVLKCAICGRCVN